MDKYVLVGLASSLTVLILFGYWTFALGLPITIVEMTGFTFLGFSLSIETMNAFKKKKRRR